MKRKNSNNIDFGTINLFIYNRTEFKSYSRYDLKNV